MTTIITVGITLRVMNSLKRKRHKGRHTTRSSFVSFAFFRGHSHSRTRTRSIVAQPSESTVRRPIVFGLIVCMVEQSAAQGTGYLIHRRIRTATCSSGRVSPTEGFFLANKQNRRTVHF